MYRFHVIYDQRVTFIVSFTSMRFLFFDPSRHFYSLSHPFVPLHAFASSCPLFTFLALSPPPCPLNAPSMHFHRSASLHAFSPLCLPLDTFNPLALPPFRIPSCIFTSIPPSMHFHLFAPLSTFSPRTTRWAYLRFRLRLCGGRRKVVMRPRLASRP